MKPIVIIVAPAPDADGKPRSGSRSLLFDPTGAVRECPVKRPPQA